MSGKRTKRPRKECARRLGRRAYKTDGHVSITTAIVRAVNKYGRMLLGRKQIDAPPVEHHQRDEFRFFKKHRATHKEVAAQWVRILAYRAARDLRNERNNDHIADLRRTA